MSPSYALPDYVEPAQHPNQSEPGGHARPRLARARRAVSAGSSWLLAATVSALLVGANQWVESWTDGNLLSAWIVLWLLAFAALALLAVPSRRAAKLLGAALKARHQQRLKAEQDEQYWQLALSDPRLMAEIRRAMPTAPAVENSVGAIPWRYLYVLGRWS